jgi:topoisomerase IV subunit A
MAEGFVGMDLKRDENAEFVCECSDIDDIIVFLKMENILSQRFQKNNLSVRDIIHVGLFTRNDERTIYNAVYKNGKGGEVFVKEICRFRSNQG